MNEAEAHATLQRFAADDPAFTHACDAEGGELFQRAALTYAAAQRERDGRWPNIERLTTTPPTRNLDGYYIMMAGLGFAPTERAARSYARSKFRLGGSGKLPDMGIVGHPQCHFLYATARAQWDALSAFEDLTWQVERARERGDRERARRLRERREQISARMRAHRDALTQALRLSQTPA